MGNKYWALLASAITVEVTASLSMKAAVDTPAWYAVVVAGYGASFVFLSLILRGGAPIGKTYGIWAAAGIALTAILGNAIFDEALTAPMIGGILLVIAGVVLVEFGAGRAARREVTT
ncbi:QacE family quaternary ammonium compound efflux SMR transporter [Rhodococcus sp. BP-252]|uniref:DMT family transporter n=1 Tax=Nocardiaceae TaxID=85025 RepID=UPI000A05CE8A|nr:MULTISPECIES: SMR family transporter [Rhodococcus]NIL78643.1 Spermidine export protein MdtJ [Rhodococcus sp. B10]MBY6412521.1 QacE family quaternary ammonium compound efflux SMR transporter [Rhodococcus sp. BP-320]MBY6417224.1 QacE family quaternary ammonium compound efflux SMR transporter [Rhodococcus sp. BP-321]MBY6424149.1 QacE family quaternary ammonium compound efflux SMR transporter [Rhodococcus sp. BP-324]MBY6427248.1 QacE family quaternary ammonium compound efflux SMR transporter [R